MARYSDADKKRINKYSGYGTVTGVPIGIVVAIAAQQPVYIAIGLVLGIAIGTGYGQNKVKKH